MLWARHCRRAIMYGDGSRFHFCLLSKLVQLLYRKVFLFLLTLLHSEWPKLYRVLAILSAIGLKVETSLQGF